MRDFLLGIAPDHWPALVAAVLVPVGWALVAWVVAVHAAVGDDWACRLRARWAAIDTSVRWSVWLLVTTAVVHLALPLGHAGSPALTVGFLASGAAFGWLAWRAVAGRRWRGPAAALLAATLVVYLVVAAGQEEPDQVGTATALIELAAFGLCLVPRRDPHRTLHRVLLRPLASTALFTGTVVVGLVVWIVFAVGHDHASAEDSAAPHGAGQHGAGQHGAAPHGAGQHGVGQHDGAGHDHGGFLARAQAGILMRPAGPPPTVAQARAAAELARRTEAAMARYRDYHVAIADGFHPTGPLAGLQVHFEHKAHQNDGRILDAEAPEQLVYAAEGGRIALIGVVFQMQRAGQPGPAIGGSTTRWHAHNVCVALLPPGFGVVSPFGSCPYTAITVTVPEMMHVWLHNPPGGAYVDKPDDAWVRGLLAREGRPM
jgi:hypothetical protein